MLFTGEPVADDNALALGLLPGPVDGPEPDGFRRLAGPFGLVDLDNDPADAMADSLSAIRIYAGYAGWSAGHLEDEVAEGAWYVVDGRVPATFLGRARGALALACCVASRGDLAFVATPSTDPC